MAVMSQKGFSDARIFVSVLALATVASVGLFVSLRNDVGTAPAASSGVRVVASAYPVAYLAERIGGPFVRVTTVTPVGGEPHDYEPTPADILAARGADLFLFIGRGFDPWAEDLRSDLSASGVMVLGAREFVAFGEGTADVGAAESPDPHFWLDPILFARSGEVLRDALATADPAHADAYRRNADALSADIDALDARYRSVLESCSGGAIITAHDSFGYLGKRYGFTAYAIAGVSPEDEPSPRRIAELAAVARERGIAYVFAEPLVGPKAVETLAREIGAQVLMLHPIEGLTIEERASSSTYETIMEENLQNLALALRCL